MEAQRPQTPWRSIEKLNNLMGILKPGDSVLFKKGDAFYGQLVITASGTSVNAIAFSAYGTGNQPVITGLTTLSEWRDTGGGVKEVNCTSCKEKQNVVVINGVLQRLGRYPNAGYLVYDDFLGKNLIISNQLPNPVDWRGAEIVMRKKHWQIDRKRITGQMGDTIRFAPASQYEGTKGFGFFIQGSRETLDTAGEWYYNPDNKRLSVFFGAGKNDRMTISAGTIDTLILISGSSHITLENLLIEGANQYGILINNADHVTLEKCSVENNGYNAIQGVKSSFITITKSSLNHTLNNAIVMRQADHAIINGNTIKNTGFLPGMGDDKNGSYVGISVGSDASVTYNTIDSTGYIPIMFGGNSCVISNNVINTYCFNVDDGGGIYTFGGRSLVTFKQRIVKDNIVLNGMGAPDGAHGTLEVHGIYMDEGASQVTISGNTVAYCKSSGLLLHHANDIILDSNVIVNDNGVIYLSEDRNSPAITQIRATNNLFFSTSVNQPCLIIKKTLTNPEDMGTFNNNLYWKVGDTSAIVQYHDYTDPDATKQSSWWKKYSLSAWKLLFHQDQNSRQSPIMIDDMNQILFRYNPTRHNQTISLDGNYLDSEGAIHSKNIILTPFKSIILMKSPNTRH